MCFVLKNSYLIQERHNRCPRIQSAKHYTGGVVIDRATDGIPVLSTRYCLCYELIR